MDKRKVLFICTGNSCRSQMAEAIVNQELRDSWRAFSAGVTSSEVNPRAVRVMDEIGVDISRARSKSVAEFAKKDDFDLIVTLCDEAKESCPVFPGHGKQIHLGFEDPSPYSDQPDAVALPEFRRIRDEIRKQIIHLLRHE